MLTCPQCDELAEIFVSADDTVTLQPCGHTIALSEFLEPVQLQLPFGD
jgi:ribosomal protein S27E